MTRGAARRPADARPRRASRRLGAGSLAVALAAALAAALAGCTSKPPVKDARTTPVSSSAPEPFADLRHLLVGLGRMRDASDAAAARALRPRLVASAKSLLLMRPPHDLRREDILRFLDARERFTEAVNGYGRASDGTDDAALWDASRDVEASFWAWYDTYRGRPTEGNV